MVSTRGFLNCRSKSKVSCSSSLKEPRNDTRARAITSNPITTMPPVSPLSRSQTPKTKATSVSSRSTSRSGIRKSSPKQLTSSQSASSSISVTTSTSTSRTSIPTPSMSKLSEGLKALISAAHARPGYTRAPSTIKSVFSNIAQDAKSHQIGLPAWVTLSTAASMTLNCPEAMTQLFTLTRELNPSQSTQQAIVTAELMREVGLKCISFNGIPRSINCLGAFYNALPSDIRAGLGTTGTRSFSASNVEDRVRDGYALWDSVYFGFERKLLDKLALSHPDLPVHIINSHYANVLSDPPTTRVPGAKIGRVLTSLLAIACLRSQTGVGPQVTSHVFGLRKAYERGDAGAEGEEPVDGGEWLASEEGNRWILESVDRIVAAVTGGEGTTFAPGLRPKL